ncbi:aminoimidazole riboside kinase [Salinivibrio kushneri]|uniref:aminoimidazole riboside kinase n=1 Tax=Salinivibrio kushneri TaxID=1908198 RepID=UPI00098872A9|nr:aminoimidazole riboside kinase [Salinivibrio kushneri]OOE48365.1 aminoimidazole riboside kinase [Salinivibrio kushneri]OOE49345.1 aminoimidazole riboside kinase [Salinivibrio kushneri]OOE55384.1 aminoimidazole riboside kinase [Salinivibrio kushneri]
MNKVWVTGDAVVDLIPDGEHHYLKCPGGAPANVAVAIARLGGETGFIGRVGSDPLGGFMLNTLASENVDTRFMHRDETQRTSTVLVDLDEHGERSFTFMVKPSADQFVQPYDFPLFEKGQWLHACSIALANEPSRSATLGAMQAYRDKGGFVSFDPNLREDLWQSEAQMLEAVWQALPLADVVKVSDDELTLLTKPFITEAHSVKARLAALVEHAPNVSLWVVTQGSEGARVAFHQMVWQVATTPAKVVDTTGAGDAFMGGLLAALAKLSDWQTPEAVTEAVRQGNRCGALATTAKGAMTALPTALQLAGQ